MFSHSVMVWYWTIPWDQLENINNSTRWQSFLLETSSYGKVMWMSTQSYKQRYFSCNAHWRIFQSIKCLETVCAEPVQITHSVCASEGDSPLPSFSWVKKYTNFFSPLENHVLHKKTKNLHGHYSGYAKSIALENYIEKTEYILLIFPLLRR